MKKIKQHFLICLFSASIIVSCISDKEAKSENKNTNETETLALIEQAGPHDLILIDNQKWVIDEGMKLSIDSIDIRLSDFNGAELQDYSLLSSDLARHTKTIIGSCTMKGQAHDELHKWLLPFIDLRKELDSVENLAAAESITSQLNNEIIIFKTYFE